MQTCSKLLAKMIDNVPDNVVLTEVITLLPAKVAEAYITVIRSQLLFKTTLRVRDRFLLSDPIYDDLT